MPGFPIVDAHVHLWDPRHIRMPWLDDHSSLNKRFGLAEYNDQTNGVTIDGMVYLEVDVAPHYTLLEAEWVVELAREEPRLKAIVPHAPLEYGEEVRVYLAELAGLDSRIKGVRRLLQGEEDVAYCLRPDFVRGVQMLAEYNLSFDVCIFHQQLASVIKLVRQCPDTSFILDHIGKPRIKEHILDPWRDQISELALLPNVVCKVSGLVTEADWNNWTSADLAPYVEHVLAAFGEDRVVFGGDWPVSTQASTYRKWVETLDALTIHLSPQAKRKLWNENARRFYRM